MNVRRTDPQTIVLGEIDTVIGGLLLQVPASADPAGSEAATARLFPKPSGGREPESDEEWREYVEPDLRELFRDAVGVVQDDLEKMTAGKSGESRELRVPTKHLDAWIHALNQARLALAARHEFTDRELEHDVPVEGGERSFVLFQIHFYGLLQELFLREAK